MDETHLNYLKSIHMQSRGYVYLLVSAPKKKEEEEKKDIFVHKSYDSIDSMLQHCC